MTCGKKVENDTEDLIAFDTGDACTSSLVG